MQLRISLIRCDKEKQNDSITTALIEIEPISLLNPNNDLISIRDPMKEQETERISQ